MEWSNERILKFLELYQSEELIWNPKNRNHKNKQKNNDAWSRIAIAMGTSVNNLKLKKNSLMATFRTHLRKKKSSLRSGTGVEDVYEPIWFAYPIMETFLAPVYDCGDTIDTEENASSPPNEEQHDNEHNEQQSEPDQLRYTESRNNEITHNTEDTDHHSRVETTNDNSAHISQRHRRRQLASEINTAQKKIEQTFETLNNVMSQKKRDADDDDCDLYGKLLAKKLRNYSNYERHLLMHEIDGLLLRKPPRTISYSYSISSPGQESNNSLQQSPVHINTPNQSRPSSAAFSYNVMPSQSPVQISIPNRPSSAAASYNFMSSQSPIQISIPNRPSSAAASYNFMSSQSPVQISIPNRPSSSTASSNFMPSQLPVQISIPNRPSSTVASYTPLPSQSPDQTNYQTIPSDVSTTQSNQVHILSEDIIVPSVNILEHAFTNAEIDESDLV